MLNAIKTVVSTALNAVKTTFSTIWNNVKSSVTTVLNNIRSSVWVFTTRIKCGCCGGSCRRQVQGSSDGKIAYWRCSGGSATNCGIKSIREPELMEIAAGLMGLPDFDGDAFREQVDHITMVKSGLLEFTFADGHTEAPERRKAMSEHMKQVRRERYWNSKGKSKQSQQP